MSCKYCSGEEVFKFSNGWFWIANDLHGEAWSWNGEPTDFQEYNAFNYCPMCGTPVTEPEPLTLEELWKMGKTPYWHKSLQKDGVDEWQILPECVAQRPESYHYGTRWLAYPHKPRE